MIESKWNSARATPALPLWRVQNSAVVLILEFQMQNMGNHSNTEYGIPFKYSIWDTTGINWRLNINGNPRTPPPHCGRDVWETQLWFWCMKYHSNTEYEMSYILVRDWKTTKSRTCHNTLLQMSPQKYWKFHDLQRCGICLQISKSLNIPFYVLAPW